MHNIGRVYFYPIKFSKRLRTLWLIKVQTTENLQNQKRKFEKFLPNSKSNKTFQILTIYRKRLESELILYRKYSNISSKIRFWNIERRGCKRPRVFHRDSGDGRGDQAALSRSSTRGESRLRWKSSSRSLSGRINPASINARPRSAERAYHRCCQHQRRVVAPAKSLDARKHEPPAVSSISSSVSGSLRSRPPPPRRSSDASPSLAPHPTSFLSSSPGFGRCFALNIWIPRIEEPRGTAGYTERHVFLSSSRSPRFAPPPSLLSLLSLSFFFLSRFVKFFRLALENILFWKISVQWKWSPSRWMKNLTPCFGRYGFERAIQYYAFSIRTRFYLFWMLKRKNIYFFGKFGLRYFSILFNSINRSSEKLYLSRRDFGFFWGDLLKLDIFRSSGIIQFYHYRNINVFESTRFGGREKGIYLRRKIYNIVTGDTIT